MSSNICLIGMMGCGKSTTGPRLADLLDREFIDLDRVIATEAGQSIEAIFRQYDENHFRRAEARQLSATCRNKGKIIACGGGVVLSADNRRILKTQQTVFLSLSPVVLQRRLGRVKNRPMLDESTPLLPQLEALVRQREPLYRECARWEINGDELSPSQVAQKVMAMVEQLAT